MNIPERVMPIKTSDGGQRWLDEESEYHREDGPAYINGGTQIWFLHGQKHRLDGPAFLTGDIGYEEWWTNGKMHRLDGPAYIRSYGSQEWFVNGQNVTEEVREWMKQMSIRPDWENWGDVEKILFRLRF